MDIRDSGAPAVPFARGWIGQDWLYPLPRTTQASAVMHATVAHALSGLENALASGTATMILDNGVYAAQMGGGNNDDAMSIGCAAQLQIATLPANHELEDFRRIHWWRWRQRLSGAGTARLFCPIILLGNQVGTSFFGANTTPTTGHGVGLALNGAGAFHFIAKVSAGAVAGLSIDTPVVWPRALDQWTEVWYVLLGATATKPARFRLYLERKLVQEVAWPNDGVTGSTLPILEGGATSFYWAARANAVAHPGLLLRIAGWRYRQGFYDVDGTELNGK